ncbi:MAG: squalene--hopene cyclase, partial [Bryobacterales bacterium]|nr:squalene--hopene cyclase [Bryobacterales bacterium]
ATAVSALALAEPGCDVTPGLAWLANNQNADGGWGDTVLNKSNISTTLLVWCAFSIAPAPPEVYGPAVRRAEAWLTREAGSLEPARLVSAILRRYGNDRTFSVPILTVLAVAGKLGSGRSAWRDIPQLPFELAALPHQLFGWLQLPVVSYALPALIAIGQVRHHHRPSRVWPLRAARNLLQPATSRLLGEIQPSTGGYLEATPLTSFVAISLAAAGRAGDPVVREGVRFLRQSMREDGSWPIDTNLSTWVTTLAVNALAPSPEWSAALDRRAIREWLLAQQYRVEHPYTHAAPGGWAWTPLPGGVPDADDTAGALLALRHLGPVDEPVRQAARLGLDWLLGLQNSDGGMPTFCRGWGKLPFDRSGADLTAHAVAAWRAWLPDADPAHRARVEQGIARALRYLARVQRPDGAWAPLWFGNEHAPNDENPVFGTSRTLVALAGSGSPLLPAGANWLRRAQNADGGWGGAPGAPSTVEETSLALQALWSLEPSPLRPCPQTQRALDWLAQATGDGRAAQPNPIGFYFARLWYFEELYGLCFPVGALARLRVE